MKKIFLLFKLFILSLPFCYVLIFTTIEIYYFKKSLSHIDRYSTPLGNVSKVGANKSGAVKQPATKLTGSFTLIDGE